jgi:hypothetical protein
MPVKIMEQNYDLFRTVPGEPSKLKSSILQIEATTAKVLPKKPTVARTFCLARMVRLLETGSPRTRLRPEEATYP